MNVQRKFLKKAVWLFAFVTLLACSDDETPMDPGGNNGSLEIIGGLSDDDIETYEGEIGITVSTRNIARKGYTPAQAEITVNATSGDFSKTVTIDPLLNISNLSFMVSELSEAAKTELSDGIGISIKILDINNNILVDQAISAISFTSGLSTIEVDATGLEDQLAEVNLKEGVRYHIQTVPGDGDEINGAIDAILHTSGATYLNGAPIIAADLDKLDYTSSSIDNFYSYYFEEVPGEPLVYYIYVKNINDTNVKHYLYINPSGSWLSIRNLAPFGVAPCISPTSFFNCELFKFKIRKASNGLFTIIPKKTNKAFKFTQVSTTRNGAPYEVKGLKANDDTSSADPVYFRVLSLDIDWDIEILESKFLTPILPPAVTSFAYNSTLINCSSGPLSQEVGVEQTTQSVVTAGWSESMTLSTSKTYELSITLEAEVSASFRGFGASSKRTITGGYKVNKEITRTRAASEALTNSQSVTLSSKRIQTVPPGKATLISDNYQTYSNINIPFVQRYRIKGNYPEGAALSGKEITTQFAFNQFTGVITAVGVDFIEVTVRGITNFDKLIDTETIARDVPPNCN